MADLARARTVLYECAAFAKELAQTNADTQVRLLRSASVDGVCGAMSPDCSSAADA